MAAGSFLVGVGCLHWVAELGLKFSGEAKSASTILSMTPFLSMIHSGMKRSWGLIQAEWLLV